MDFDDAKRPTAVVVTHWQPGRPIHLVFFCFQSFQYLSNTNQNVAFYCGDNDLYQNLSDTFIALWSFDRSSLCWRCASRQPWWHQRNETWQKHCIFTKACICHENGVGGFCYSGRWKMPVEGVRSGRIEAQLPRVWHRSSGVKPYLEGNEDLLWNGMDRGDLFEHEYFIGNIGGMISNLLPTYW